MKDHKKVAAAALLLIGVANSRSANAQATTGFGRDGQFILSAERLFGLSFTKTTVEDGAGGGTRTDSQTTVALLSPPLSATAVSSPYQIPRMAFDVVIASGLTAGGAIGFVSSTGSTKLETSGGGASTERDAPSTTVFTLAPRIGYVLNLSSLFAFWPRLGIAYHNFGVSSVSNGATPVTAEGTITGVGVNLEPMFVLSPVAHVGVIFAPVADIPLSGSQSTRTTPSATVPPDDKVRFLNLGFTVGLLAYF